ncbi:MAG: rod shape-determining protein RodA [Actinomycetota bacterium]|nr:rod shape-determining protein RodA [Actinomycetota bacterium]
MTEPREWVRNIDFGLILAVLGLTAFSLVTLYSISLGSAASGPFAYKQAVWVAGGLVIMTIVAFLDYSRLRHYMPFIYGANIFLLVVIFLIGKMALGAQRWIEIGGFRFQPSEFSKLLIVLTLGAMLAERKGEIEGWRDIFLAGAHVSPVIALILVQPDLGTALILIAIMAGMLIAAGIKPKQIAVLGAATYVAIGLVFKFQLLQAYQMRRLTVFLNPDIDPLGSGYNLRQSIIAIGSGGIFGKGLFSGTQSRLDFLPPAVRHTDFIFAVIGEELGFIGGAVLLALVLLLLVRTFRIAALSRNHYGLLIACGIGSMWIFQVLVNIGMTIGIMPVTGIPLPFVSYGGSSMLMNMAAVGLLLNIYRRRWT